MILESLPEQQEVKRTLMFCPLAFLTQVSSLFKDGTIGSDINIVVVSLLLLEEDPVSRLTENTWADNRWSINVIVSVIHLQLGLTISHHADQSLNSFCQWQSGLLGKGGKRHDHAVLLTGLDICSWKNEPCDTLGMNKTNLKLMRVLLSEITRQIRQ